MSDFYYQSSAFNLCQTKIFKINKIILNMSFSLMRSIIAEKCLFATSIVNLYRKMTFRNKNLYFKSKKIIEMS